MTPWLIGGAAVAILVAGVGGYFYGRGDGGDLCEGKHAAAALGQAVAALQTTLKAQEAVDRATGKAIVYIEKERTVTRYITREVPRHVTAETDRRFPLSVGFVRVHDAAASGKPVSEVPPPPGKSDGDASDVRPSEAATVIAGNYGSCREQAEQLKGLQDAWDQAMIIFHAPTQ